MAEVERLHLNHSVGAGRAGDLHQRQFFLPGRAFQVVGFHKRQAIPVEHEPDVDEEDAVARAPKEEFLFEQLPHATLVRAIADVVVLGHVLVQLDFIGAGIRPHLMVDELEDLDARLRQAGRLLDPIEEQLDEPAGINFSSHQKPIPPIHLISPVELSTIIDAFPPGT